MKNALMSMIAALTIAFPAIAGNMDNFDRDTNVERAAPATANFENPQKSDPGYVHNPASCSAPGVDQYSVIVEDNGAGKTWHMTDDTRSCPQAGIDDPVFKADGN